MADRSKSFDWAHPVIKLFVIIAVVASLALAAEFFQPLALAVLLAFALSPASRFFENRGLRRVPSVLVTVLLTLGLLGGIGYVVYNQVDSLAGQLPQYRQNIVGKIRNVFGKSSQGNLSQATDVLQQAVEALDEPKLNPDVQDVRVVGQPTVQDRFRTAVGPYLEFFGVGTFVLILVTFILLGREDLADRIVQLFGNRQITLTTKTMDDLGRRLSRYLAMFALINSTFGLVIGLGLWALQVPYAALWGALAGLLRFIPYVGPAVAFGLPLIFSFAQSTGIWQPLSVIVLFLIVETILNSLEPIVYGRTTGVSALSLLVAALFWTWLWGLVGLLIATPVTVCLAVLGKYIPSLSFFATLLGEEAELDQDVRLYQRLLALDQDGATEMVEASLKGRTRAEVFDTILIPVLTRAERDRARGEIDESEQAFIWRVVGEILEDLEDTKHSDLTIAKDLPGLEPGAVSRPTAVLGVAANDHADGLVLKMLGQLLSQANCPMEVVSNVGSPLALSQVVEEKTPEVVLLSHLPPVGLTPARYLVRRLRAGHPDLTILVGRWGDTAGAGSASERLSASGSNAVLNTLSEARTRIIQELSPKTATELQPAAMP